MRGDASRPVSDGGEPVSKPADEQTPSSEEPSEEGGLSRRTLVRLLVALGFGIPIAVELGTLVGLLGGSQKRTVDLGDELLRKTPQSETVVESAVYVRDPWTFEFVVEVENTSDVPYALIVGPVYTDQSGAIDGTATLEVPPGETATLRGSWEIPAASTITAVDALATWGDQRVERRVALASPPVYH